MRTSEVASEQTSQEASRQLVRNDDYFIGRVSMYLRCRQVILLHRRFCQRDVDLQMQPSGHLV